MVKVLDASALICYLAGELGSEKVKDFLIKAKQSQQNLLISSINWSEVYYFLLREYELQEVNKILQLIDTFPLDIVAVDRILASQAALVKFERKLALADSYAAALAKIHKGELITTDKDFQAVEKDIKILWLPHH